MLDHNVIFTAKNVRNAVENLKVFDEYLSGACAVASAYLYKVLKKQKYDVEFVCGIDNDGQGHCWVELDDWVIDLTAIQFEIFRPDIYISRVDEYEFGEWDNIYRNKKAFEDLKRWPYDQRPGSYDKELNKILKVLAIDKAA